MQNPFRKLNIHKNGENRLLTKPAERTLWVGACLILASLLRLLWEVGSAAPYPPSVAERFGAMLEYPVAALALLTALSFLVDRVVRAEEKKDP